MMRIAGILLAAGRGSRFGGDKLLVPLPAGAAGVPAGTPVAIASATHLAQALAEVIVVLRPGHHDLATAMLAVGLATVECANADDGMGATLACGVSATRDADGWVVALADMPWIRPVTIASVAAALAAGADIVAPAYRGMRGHPVGFARRHRDALIASEGDAGARALVAASRETLTLVEVDDPGVLRDVDVPDDLASLP
ncbi:MAG: nucleotidyltransferase family protein [Casimicrobiaceae bacterium]